MPNITEKEPVYQFGVILKKMKMQINRKKILILNPEFKKEFEQLSLLATGVEPNQRPTLSELHTKLQHLISLI